MSTRFRRQHPASPESDPRGRYAAFATLFAILGALILAASFSGCRSIGMFPIPGPTPVPTPTPTPTPDPILACVPLCVGENQTGCKVVPSPGVCKHVCSTPWEPGGITLVDTPDQCPAPPTTPDPPVDPPDGTGSTFPAGHPPFTAIDGAAPKLGSAVNAAGLVVLGCALGTADCQWSVPPVEAMDALTAKLRAAGYDAGRYDDDRSGPWAGSDVIAVSVPKSGVWEEWSVYNYGGLPNGRHATAFAFKGAFRLASSPQAACPQLKRLDMKVAWLSARAVDVTPKTEGLKVCTALGFVNRRECPFGKERDDGTPNQDRVRCEIEAGPYSATIDGVEVGPIAGNPLVFWAGRAGRFVVCSREMVCNSLVLD